MFSPVCTFYVTVNTSKLLVATALFRKKIWELGSPAGNAGRFLPDVSTLFSGQCYKLWFIFAKLKVLICSHEFTISIYIYHTKSIPLYEMMVTVKSQNFTTFDNTNGW